MKSSKKRTRGPTLFKGIVADAKKLGVSHSHLWRVLKGHRKSPLLARWRALQAEKALSTAGKNRTESK
ncbi:MAG: hypothetical protein KGL39_13240 [Patescibacteria group bacterium]|nr:hypothetical protein [Patescibacteria group bacterium]